MTINMHRIPKSLIDISPENYALSQLKYAESSMIIDSIEVEPDFIKKALEILKDKLQEDDIIQFESAVIKNNGSQTYQKYGTILNRGMIKVFNIEKREGFQCNIQYIQRIRMTDRNIYDKCLNSKYDDIDTDTDDFTDGYSDDDERPQIEEESDEE